MKPFVKISRGNIPKRLQKRQFHKGLTSCATLSKPALISSRSNTASQKSFHTLKSNLNRKNNSAAFQQQSSHFEQGKTIRNVLKRLYSGSAEGEEKKRILLLGSGFVTTTVIEYLTRRPQNQLTIATLELEQAKQKVQTYAHNQDNVKVEYLDIVNDNEKLDQLISQNNVVISLIPYTFHVKVAKKVLEQNRNGHKVNMITSSYISAEMQALDKDAKDLGVTLMNAIGLDPGVDDLYAMKFIDEAHKNGDKVRHYESWCGGLPAPEDIGEGNPLKYKFSWSPKGVLMAGTNEARYLKDGNVVIVPPEELLNSGVHDLTHLHPDFDFEGYPNRDSSTYTEHYRMPEAKFILRGTLRYKGFAKFMRALKASGLVNFDASTAVDGGSWADVSSRILGSNSSSETDLAEALVNKLGLDASTQDAKSIVDGFKWLGLFSEDTAVGKSPSIGDALSHLLEQKLAFKEGERDMVFMQNKFIIDKKNGKTETITATMVLYEDNDGRFTAMAKGTGKPCAVASQLVLDGVINRKGVFAPYYEEVNTPIMETLKKEGIKMDIQREEV